MFGVPSGLAVAMKACCSFINAFISSVIFAMVSSFKLRIIADYWNIISQSFK
jgi:hypothetical protein